MSINYYGVRTTSKIALINGKEVGYDACHSSLFYKWRPAYSPKVFRYIGKGYIYKIDGVRQSFSKMHYFWVYR